MCLGVVGTVTIGENTGTVNFGGILNSSPKTATKSFSGSGGGSAGNMVNVITGPTCTNTIVANGVDQSIAANA